MKLPVLCSLIVLLMSMVLVGAGSYGIDYTLGGNNEPFGEDSIHGTHSARMTYDEKKRYIRVDLDEPLLFDDLDRLVTQIKLLTDDGKIGIDLYLDGNGDNKWSSKSSKDVKLYARPKQWASTGWVINEWAELDAFDLEYKKSGESALGKKTLDDWKTLFGNKRVVKIYIRLYKPGHGVCLIDYLRLGGYVVSFEPYESPEMKKASPRKATPGRKITYTITYGNDYNQTNLTNLVITEHYDPRTIIISASPPPDPGTNNVWTIGTVQPGYYGQIKIVMRVPKQKCKAVIDGRVSGTGYVSVRQRLSTERSSHIITNKVDISCDQFNQSATVRTAVKPVEERSITFSEHGSGTYASSEELRYTSTRLGIDRELEACRSPGMINLSHGRSLVYNASWFASRTCEDQKKLVLLSERFLYGDKLESCASAQLYGTSSKTRARIDSESNFSGLAVYEVGSRIDERNAALLDILYGNYSVVASNEINIKRSKKDDRWELYHSMKVKQTS